MTKIFFLGLLSALLLWPARARAAILFSEDYEVTLGDLTGAFGTGHSQPALDLVARNWFVNTQNSGTCNGYCSGAIVSMVGHTGAMTRALRLRYEEGPASDSDGSGREVRLGKETGFGNNPLAVPSPEIWERYYYLTQPVPANTPSCSPNCPTTSTYNDSMTKQHYFKQMSSPWGVSWVSNHAWGSKELFIGAQQAVDCPFVGGIYDCPITYPNVSPAAPLNDNQWYCIETHIKLNDVGSNNGVWETYVDGRLTMTSGPRMIQDATHRAYGIDQMIVYRQSGGYQWRFEDDFVMATTRIGCGSTPPPPAPTDTQAPTVPAGLSAQAASSSQINLTWSASSDNVGVTGYRIYRGGTQIGAVAGTSYSDSGLSASTAYSYTVAAYDAAGNASAQSVAASATTPAAPPPGPSGLLVDFGSSAGANTFGLAGWNTVIKDVYTTYQSVGPGGTMSGFNGAYDYQGVTGTARSFAAGDEIVVTWYNSGAAAATFTPQLSMTVAGRVGAGAGWQPMSSATIPAAGTATTRFMFSATTAGSYSLVNVNVNMDYGSLICDKIALVSAAAPADAMPPAKPRNMRVQ